MIRKYAIWLNGFGISDLSLNLGPSILPPLSPLLPHVIDIGERIITASNCSVGHGGSRNDG